MSPINTCVIGLGFGGLVFHVPFVLSLPDLFVLHAVVERNPAAEGGKVKARFGVSPKKIHRTLEAALEDHEIELIVITTPNDTHYPFAKAALEAGKHVLVDKPVATASAQAKELGELAKSKGLVLYAFQNRRWDSDFLALKKLLELPESSPQSLGIVVDFESRFDRHSPAKKGNWKDEVKEGNGWVYDLGAHLIDQALVLYGRPQKVTAFVQKIRGFETDDSFTIIFSYAQDTKEPRPFQVILRGHSLSVKALQPRFVVRGTKGTFNKGATDVQEDQLKVMESYETISKPDYGKEPEEIYGTLENLTENGVKKSVWPSDAAGNYQGLFKNVAAAIRNGDELAVKWTEATAVLEMIELAHKSSQEGRTLTVPEA